MTDRRFRLPEAEVLQPVDEPAEQLSLGETCFYVTIGAVGTVLVGVGFWVTASWLASTIAGLFA